MINLLPPQHAHMLRMLRLRRLALVLGIMFMTALGCLALALVPVALLTMSTVTLQRQALQEADAANAAAVPASLAKQAAADNAALKQAAAFYRQQVSLSGALEEILGISRPAGVAFSSVSLSQVKGGVLADIAGTSATRDALLAYRASIELDPRVTADQFPANDWVSPANIAFTMHLEVAKPANGISQPPSPSLSPSATTHASPSQ